MTRPLIIETPSLQSLRQRYAYAILTLFFWLFWFYLWLPVISLLAWLLGIENFYDQMIVQAGLEAFLELIGFYLTVISVLCLSLISWGLYNQIRFRGKERRTQQMRTETTELAHFFDLTPATVRQLQQTKNIELTHDDNGKLVHIDL